MKEKKRGFTLIELLAVIVILAVIALIATPIVLNLINTARKGAFARSAEGVLKAAKLYYSSSLLDIEGATNITFDCNNNECVSNKVDDEGNNIKLDVDGNTGIGDVSIDSDGAILLYLGDGTYCAKKTKKEEKITVSKSNCTTGKLESKIYTTGDAVTLGGYNWHVIGEYQDEQGRTLDTLLMDAGQLGDNSNMAHCGSANNSSNNCTFNGTYYVYSWDKSLIRTYLNSTFLSDLESRISNKLVSIEICADSSRDISGSIEQSYGGYLMSELDTLGKTNSCLNAVSDKVRLISYSEYYNMNPYYTSTSSSYPNLENIEKITGNSDYTSWLYSSSIGDWWSMGSFSYSDDSIVRIARYVYGGGHLDYGHGSSSYLFGVRPVITIIK